MHNYYEENKEESEHENVDLDFQIPSVAQIDALTHIEYNSDSKSEDENNGGNKTNNI